jgi:hypothetical protein
MNVAGSQVHNGTNRIIRLLFFSHNIPGVGAANQIVTLAPGATFLITLVLAQFNLVGVMTTIDDVPRYSIQQIA